MVTENRKILIVWRRDATAVATLTWAGVARWISIRVGIYVDGVFFLFNNKFLDEMEWISELSFSLTAKRLAVLCQFVAGWWFLSTKNCSPSLFRWDGRSPIAWKSINHGLSAATLPPRLDVHKLQNPKLIVKSWIISNIPTSSVPRTGKSKRIPDVHTNWFICEH